MRRRFWGTALAVLLSCGVAGGQTVEAVLRQLKTRPSTGHLSPEGVIAMDFATAAFVIAGAGSVHGAGGTYFHTDLTILNVGSISQTIGIAWLAMGVDNRGSGFTYMTLAANSFYDFEDVVSTVLHTSGLGAILVIGMDPQHNADASALLDGASRSWTNQPNASGTVSLGFSPVSITDLNASYGWATALGLRQDPHYRTNVGIVNLSIDTTYTWTVHIVGNPLDGSQPQTATMNITVPPLSMVQQAIPSGNFSHLAVEALSPAPGFWWSMYGVSVDNTTGDGWVVKAAQ